MEATTLLEAFDQGRTTCMRGFLDSSGITDTMRMLRSHQVFLLTCLIQFREVVLI